MTIPGTDKFFAHSKDVNTTISGPESALEESHWYTIDDLSNTVRPYQVFTALLTQSGGDVPSTGSGDEYINSGVTYTITANPDNYDLTIYGAPNSNAGTSFIANQSANLPYTYSLTFSYNTGVPVAAVLENTIGNVWFNYIDIGLYNINSSGLFTNTKTINTIDQTGNISGINDQPYYVYCRGGVTNYLELIVLDTGLNGINGLLYDKLIEIRVYN